MVRHKSLLSVFSLALFLAVACNKPNDDAITTAIKAKMFSDPLLKSASVNVVSKDGIVTITGVVPDDAARLAAETIASKTTGVKQVIDSTTMAPPPPAGAEAVIPPQPEPRPAPEPPKSSARNKRAARAPKPEPAPAAPVTEATSAASTSPAPETPATPPTAPPPPPPPQPVTVTIPEGSILTIRTIDSIDSASSSAGQMYRASLDAPVVVDDRVVLPKGLNVKLKLVEASSAGKFKGKSELTVSLESVTYQGKTYMLSTSDVQEKGASRGKRSAAVIGGSAVLGALIGGLAGGGKGAAIGAGVGAGGGTAVQAMTKGEQVKIQSETRLDFTLHAPLAVTYIPQKHSAHAPPANSDQTSQADQPTQP
jgi:hypothetical protein